MTRGRDREDVKAKRDEEKERERERAIHYRSCRAQICFEACQRLMKFPLLIKDIARLNICYLNAVIQRMGRLNI